jgi:hypothetical protein
MSGVCIGYSKTVHVTGGISLEMLLDQCTNPNEE